MEGFEKKGAIQILLLLFQNPNMIFSKYELEKKLNLNKRTVDNRIKFLKSLLLINEILEIGPRKRTEIILTTKGKEISEFFLKIRENLE